MEDAKTQTDKMPQVAIRKACQIMIMFPVENDEDALAIKKAIDDVVGDLPDKKYNFSINEM